MYKHREVSILEIMDSRSRKISVAIFHSRDHNPCWNFWFDDDDDVNSSFPWGVERQWYKAWCQLCGMIATSCFWLLHLIGLPRFGCWQPAERLVGYLVVLKALSFSRWSYHTWDCFPVNKGSRLGVWLTSWNGNRYITDEEVDYGVMSNDLSGLCSLNTARIATLLFSATV